MRKLVKKLALVLALVLAIGCIAPASAQAAEGVRRSWNFAPGEFKPTLNLTVDQLSLPVEDIKAVNLINNLPRSMTTDDLFDFVKLAY